MSLSKLNPIIFNMKLTNWDSILLSEIWVGIERDASSGTWVWTTNKTPATQSFIRAVDEIIDGRAYCPAITKDNSEITIDICNERENIANFVLCEKKKKWLIFKWRLLPTNL